MYPADFDDFNFRVAYNEEQSVPDGLKNFIIDTWKKTKKNYKFINRVSFSNPLYPCQIDITIAKYGDKLPDRFGNEGRGEMKRTYNVQDSHVFDNNEIFEIEIEVNNKEVGPTTDFNSAKSIYFNVHKSAL